jgi:Peptidase family M28
MKRYTLLLTFSLFALTTIAQTKRPAAAPAPVLPETQLSRAEIESHIRFLASDELQGRRTGEPGNATAARYIAEQFRQQGLTPAPGQSDFFQRVTLDRTGPAGSGSLIAGADTLRMGRNLLMLTGNAAELTAPTVYVGYGLTEGTDGYNGRDVRGKIVVALVGSAEAKSPQELFSAARTKRKLATDKGAAALVELYAEATPWGLVAQYFSREQISLPASGSAATPSSMPHLWANNQNNVLKSLKTDAVTVMLRVGGRSRSVMISANVAGLIVGSDPALRNEYVILSAHFDHVGVGKQGGGAYTPADSIFNGARDNAIGTAALLAAAKALQQQPPRRSVLIVALTGEEVGLLGSKFYAENPLVPLSQTVFDLNIDGAGYSDTTLVSVLGLNRTGAAGEIEMAARRFRLTAFADPAPEQGLFDRSDNVSFAAKGIPAPTFSPGFKAFDEVIAKNYHQVSDEAATLDFAYIQRFCQAYCYAARLIADRPTRPQWSAGDKYEAAAKQLYGH